MKMFLKSTGKQLLAGLVVVMLVFQSVLPVYATTFTAGGAKRNSAGPFAAGVMVQGDTATDNTMVDSLTATRGSQIANTFYQNYDVSQGTIVLWITPEWYGNDDGILYITQDSNAIVRLFIQSNKLKAYISQTGTFIDGPSISSWTPGTTYNIVFSWDIDNTIDGANYFRFSVNDTHSYSGSSLLSIGSPGSNIDIGGASANRSINALIEGLTIYRRPLFDGTYGIDVGNGDEIAQIYNSGTGKDPTLITGSWDVVFALPTNASTGALTTGTGNAWSHPHSSNLLYTSTTNTGGFMMDGTYTSDGWQDEGTPSSVAALATGEKIFGGGYKTTSDSANEGIYYSKSVTAGDDWVIRALGHSDGTCSPKVILYNQTGSSEIGSLAGTTTSTRTDPDTYIFTGEAPSGMTELRVKLINTASSGTCYWHQVEVLRNKMTNPSLESGSGTFWTPTGYSSGAPSAAWDADQENSDVHSGSGSIKLVVTNGNNSGFQYTSSSAISFGGKFHAYGHWGKKTVSSGGELLGLSYNQASIDNQYKSPNPCCTELGMNITSSSWEHKAAVMRTTNTSEYAIGPRGSTYGGSFNATYYSDDWYFLELTDVSLTVTPASQANSTENTDEIRVDGLDTYIETDAVSLGTTSGYASFDYRPRHSASNMTSFGVTTPYIVSFKGDGDDYINVYWNANNSVTMAYSMGGTTASSTWNATSAVSSGSQYGIVLSYTGGSTMTLSVDGTTRITLSSIPSSFGVAPNDVYFGTDTSGTNQGDATYSNIVFDNTAPSISLTALSPDPNSDNTPSITGTATEAIGTVSTVQFQMDGTGGSWSSCSADDSTFDESSEAFTCTPSSALSDGSHTMYVRATDSNGNTTASSSESTDTFTIDTTGPGIPTVTPPSSPTASSSQTWGWSSVTDSISEITNYIYKVSTDVAGTSLSVSETTLGTVLSVTTSLTDGVHHFFVKAKDALGNIGDYSEGKGVTVDTVKPSSFSLDQPGDDTVTSNVRPTFRFKKTTDPSPSSGLARYEVWVEGSVYIGSIDPSDPGGSHIREDDEKYVKYDGDSIEVYAKKKTLSEKKYSWEVKAVDNAGNARGTGSRTLTIDTSSPTLQIGSIAQVLGLSINNTNTSNSTGGTTAYTTSDTTPTFSGIADSGTKVTVTVTSDPVTCTDTSDTNSHWECTLPTPLTLGTHTVSIKAEDKAGNTTTIPSFTLYVGNTTLNTEVTYIEATQSINNTDNTKNNVNSTNEEEEGEGDGVIRSGKPDKVSADTKSNKTYSVTMTIKDSEGNPIPSAILTLHSKPITTKTDKAGKATFTKVPYGTHKLIIAYADYIGEQALSFTDMDKNHYDVGLSVTMNHKYREKMLTFVGGIILGVLFAYLYVRRIKYLKK
jgi:hypothetical protein